MQEQLFRFLDAQLFTFKEWSDLSYLEDKIAEFEESFLDQELDEEEVLDLAVKYQIHCRNKVA
jgi:hypothetical protein